MNRSLVFLALLAPAFAHAEAVKLDFEGFAEVEDTMSVDHYQSLGVTFNDVGTIVTNYWQQSGTYFTIHDGLGGLAPADPLIAYLDGSRFDFSGWISSPNDSAGFDLYFAGSLVQSLSTPPTEPFRSAVQLSAPGVEFDEIRIIGGYGTFMVDDIAFNTEAVPEPATLSALGLGALSLVRRRKSASR